MSCCAASTRARRATKSGRRPSNSAGNVDRGASRLAERALIDRAVLTPKIELPIERRLQLLQRAPATCQRRRRFTLRAETLAVDLEVGVDPRVQRRPRGIGERERLACPR